MFKLSKEEKHWILYDVGNSAFILLVSTILPIYFNYLAEKANLNGTDYMAYWGYAASIATIIVAFLGPILGSIGDTKNLKKRLFINMVGIGAIGCSLLGLASSWYIFLVIFVIAKVGYSLSIIYYDSMLSDVTTEDRVDKVSSAGFAWGYICSCIPFVISLVLILGCEKIGISFGHAMTIALFLNGI